jgi:putative Mg2+ transporter-C (MgtC) family protein
VLAIPIGWDRERETRSLGLRTFPLVAVASCGYMLIGQSLVGDNPEALSRVLYGLMTGIGFIGGGAILKDGGNVSGTATAASIWNTGAVGAAVAFQRYEIAIALALVNFLILRLLQRVKRSIP